MNEQVNTHMAASALTSWKQFNGKHGLEHHQNDHLHEEQQQQHAKRARTGHMEQPDHYMMAPAHYRQEYQHKAPVAVMAVHGKPELKPFPFYYYRDHSTDEDPDPLTPLTFPGRVPNFPAKLHVILAKPEYADVIDWMPHGRSWRVLKPREFETKIIPKFFEHSKFSSFVRQANGWGFRRITQGPDRNSYYHERFLRGLPHLCKTMKRPGVAEKKVVDPDLEPDFSKISEMYPVPKNADEESMFLQKTLESGPNSRMPIITGHFLSNNSHQQQGNSDVNSVSSSEGTANTKSSSVAKDRPRSESYSMSSVPQHQERTTVTPETHLKESTQQEMMFQVPIPPVEGQHDHSYAAGFAAAAAHYQQHFYHIMQKMAASGGQMLPMQMQMQVGGAGAQQNNSEENSSMARSA